MSDHPPEALEAARKLFAGECEFVAGANHTGIIPPDGGVPEIAFIGRSNVGKSSLINALTGRKALARVSITPGRTKQLNFFLLAGRLMLVDLPGYGYAKAPKQEVAAWNGLIKDYLRGRACLKRVLVLIDARRGVLEVDTLLMGLLDEAAVSYQLVLTKTDKLSAQELADVAARTAQAAARHPAAHPELLSTSAESKAGIPELRAELAGFARA